MALTSTDFLLFPAQTVGFEPIGDGGSLSRGTPPRSRRHPAALQPVRGGARHLGTAQPHLAAANKLGWAKIYAAQYRRRPRGSWAGWRDSAASRPDHVCMPDRDTPTVIVREGAERGRSRPAGGLAGVGRPIPGKLKCQSEVLPPSSAGATKGLAKLA